ncbi:MAG: sigma-70 family RNA polymerase sigma factor [candidate division Zixibacteria bacterium]|nr:sigma-70 family RNA polymerase sigma factor [candidate division Zixibacteria bacterium]NIR68011.1 sigma-70 family RNA polymerase sigma factor [candidate division Zixibacteria bacterium]NIS17517.1 sigma-70 family RNA polymerase sigma factor [candidate division Zixibacteria bacterium]NIS49218.1 sigma-70 family RNA polymerase sigma factor [candidate division Zixibacteria bacterium]NIT53826.1 sigma-70 family RNA polymerase sigma factor [candidate division Zixibacteria bacterium]
MAEQKKVNLDEKKLVAKAKRGDKKAFGELVRHYSKPVYYLAYRFVRDHDTADELAQESFVKAYQALDSFIEGKSFKSWIFAIVSNLSINYLKRKKRETSLEDSIPDDILEDKKLASNPHEQMTADDLGKQIAKAVDNLPEEFKSVFILRTYEDMSYEEIASSLGIEVGTVMSRLFRARARLKEELKDYL